MAINFIKCKKLHLLSILVAVLVAVTACASDIYAVHLPVHEFPLSEINIVDALQKSGLSWTVGHIQEEQEDTIQHENEYLLDSLFTLYKGTAKVGWIRSVSVTLDEKRDEERVLQLLFTRHSYGSYTGRYIPPMEIYTPTYEYWENIIVFLTLLFGGFNCKNQVFQYFNSEIDMVTRHPIKPSPVSSVPLLFVDFAVWDRMINGVYVRTRIMRPTDSPNGYFSDILMSSNLDIFSTR
jgi:hypothetical protein